MSKKNNFLFNVMHVIAWIIFIGLSIEAGALIVNFIFSIFNPEIVSKLYQKLDLSQMYQKKIWAFYGMYSFVLIIVILKSILFYWVVALRYKLDLSKPFSSAVSKQISQISYFTFSIGIFSFIAKLVAKSLSENGYEINKLEQFWVDSSAFILMSAIIYIIAVIFKKGIELQNENELTI